MILTMTDDDDEDDDDDDDDDEDYNDNDDNAEDDNDNDDDKDDDNGNGAGDDDVFHGEYTVGWPQVGSWSNLVMPPEKFPSHMKTPIFGGDRIKFTHGRHPTPFPL